MAISRRLLVLAAFAAAPAFGALPAPKQAPAPHLRQALPPSDDQVKYDLAPTHKPRNDLLPKKQQQLQALTATAAASCSDVNQFATHSGAALADYVATLPDYECTYALFSISSSMAATVYSSANLNAVAARFVQEAGRYDASNMALVNLVLFLRAGYYLAAGGTTPAFPASLATTLRTPIHSLVDGSALYRTNPVASNTARETFTLITNMHDETLYLPSIKGVVQRFTNSGGSTANADALKQESAAGGLTGALTVFFRAHSNPDAAFLQTDPSYPTTLNNFLVADKQSLLGSNAAYELTDVANETFRFMQYSALKATVKPMVQATLNSSTMTGPDNDLWLAAASAVKYYDNANCAQYGTCNFETRLADAVLAVSYACSPTIKLRAQQMSSTDIGQVCSSLATEEGYAHTMLQTQRTPVAHDNNTTLELVVFDDYTNYSKYAGIIYGISTDNGGMYLEGEPDVVGNQARFIAHEASWLRPTFKVWNLEHEFVHYIDGRFDMYGDFAAATAQPTVWWIEGIAEYLSLKNNNQVAIDAARTRQYRLSEIFGNTYDMNDYVNRAYRWGYMATRFMMEKHRADIDTMLPRFRLGDYNGYSSMMSMIGTRYDNEFTAWVDAATTAGEPPVPVDDVLSKLPACSSSSQLGKNCAIRNLASSSRAYLYLMLPAGAKNVKLMSGGGSGDMNLYEALDRYPTTSSYDAASTATGNTEAISIAAPVSGHWYYLVLEAKQAFSGVSVGVTYD
ncbi:MAG: collagenase [Pseudomonadota bacterium]